ncbi:hypothetical protein [Aquimarina litoralis]
MSLIKFKRNRLPWINDSIGNWLDTDSFSLMIFSSEIRIYQP